MNRRSVLSISAMTVLGLALVPSSAVSQQSLRDQLVGAWTLVSQEFTTPDGTKRQGGAGGLVGPNSRGILILDASGRYAYEAWLADRPKFKAGDQRLAGTAEEYKAAVQTFAANNGTWSVNEADKTLTRHFEGALIQNGVGEDVKDSVSLAGDELKLTLVDADGRRDAVYRRAK